MEYNAIQRSTECNVPQKIVKTVKKDEFMRRDIQVPQEPILIASTEDIGTYRVRANHIDAVIHYTQEQLQLKKANAPL